MRSPPAGPRASCPSHGLASLDEQYRAATLAAYYVLSYLSMSLPAIAAGAATQCYGLRTTSHAYAAVAALLAAAALTALAVSRTRTGLGSSPRTRPLR
ncbi:hypothetical protein [Streptomyces sp. PAL114]|uniref:hypothetical protein n=1 Tax=Streptomyces sp. PAL114 TaxID=2970893 RepID=UPI0028FD9B8E|nr:hypothetical protein [Streptomyces sp. PAL114]MDU0300791.1 hypothetical protein [Streptomyces sp. PAL114]